VFPGEIKYEHLNIKTSKSRCVY